MIEFIGLTLALFAWMAASLWLVAFFRIPIQVDSDRGARTASHGFDFERGDHSSAITWEMEDQVADLVGSTVFFSMKRLDGSPVIERAAAEVVHSDECAVLLYRLAAGDTDESGLFKAEFEVALPGPSTETRPSHQSIMVRIAPEKSRSEDLAKQV